MQKDAFLLPPMFAGTRQQAASTSRGASSSSTAEVTRYSIANSASGGSAKFPYRLNFYDRPPLEEITLEDFELWAIDRLKVLADIESGLARNRSYEEIKTLVLTRCKSFLPLGGNGNKSIETDAERKKDQYGHFVLRLAFCRSEELRARFLKVEALLFKIRFEEDSPEERKQFLDTLSFDWIPVDEKEKARLRPQLRAASYLIKDSQFETESFLKVNWTRVPDLVERRSVFVHKGLAYVPMKQQISLVLAEFTSRLSKGLEMTAKALPRLDEDDRLLPILNHLSLGFMAGITADYAIPNAADGEAITADMIKGLAVKNFPFCMRNLQDGLNRDHHLKHEGRQQYSLYLKGIGLGIEEALIFWRKSFSITSDDKFAKEYKYNIRHGYGLEGSRKNYSPRSCQMIIMGKTPGPADNHGCPFRHFSESSLSTALSTTYSLSNLETKELLSSVKSQHYHLACTRLFEIQHAGLGVQKGDGIGNGDSVEHPNMYFEKSRKLEIAAAESAGEGKVEKMEIDV